MLYNFLTKKIFICSFVVLFFLISGVVFVLEITRNKISSEEFMHNLIYKQTGLNFQAEELEANYSFLSLNIKAKNLSISEENQDEPFLYLKNSYLKIKLLPLFVRKIALSDFVADDLKLSLNREADGSFDILKYFNGKKSFFKTDLNSIKTSILSYKINICDHVSKNQFLLSGAPFSTFGLNFNGKFALYTKGDFFVLNGDVIKSSPYSIDIDFLKTKNGFNLNKQDILISSFDLSFLKNYLPNFNFKNFKATLDIKSNPIEDNNFGFILYADKVDILFDYKGEKNSIKSDRPIVFSLDFNFLNKNLNIKRGELWSDGVKILVEGKIKNILKINKIEPELKIDIKNTSINKLVQILPDTVIPLREQYIKNLKKYNANGIADGIIALKYKNKDDFDVRGRIDFSDVFLVKRPENAKTSFGYCEFLGRETLINVQANAPHDAFITVVGKSKMQLNPVGEFDIKSYGKIDLAFAHGVLMPLKDILVLKMGPLPYMKLNGTGEVELKTKGTKQKANLNGYVISNDAVVSLQNLNTILTNGNVKVEFKGSDILFNGASGVIEGAKTQIDGSANTEGDLDIKVKVFDVDVVRAMKIAQTSKIVTEPLDGAEFLKSFKPKSGNIDFNLNIYGNVPPDAVFGQQSDDVFVKGDIIFKGNSFLIEPKIRADNIVGTLKFENTTEFDLSADIFSSPFKVKGKVFQKGAKNKVLRNVPSVVEINFISDDVMSSSVGNFIFDNIQLFVPQNRAFAKFLASIFKSYNFKLKTNITASGLVNPKATTLDLSGFDFSGFVQGVNVAESNFKFQGGNITLKDKNAKFNNLRINLGGIDFLLDGGIDRFASNKPFNNLNIKFFNSKTQAYFDLLSKFLDKKKKDVLSNYTSFAGYINGKIKLYGDKIDGEFASSSLSFKDKKTSTVVTLKDGKIKLKNDKTFIKNVNLLYGTMPVYIDGYIQTDGRKNPEFNIFLTSNLNEKVCDEILNPLLKYPITPVGEVILKTRLVGNTDAYTLYLNSTLNEGVDLSFMGLTFGDTDTKREISSRVKFFGDSADVNLKYSILAKNSNKFLTSDILKITGGIKLKPDDIVFNNLKIVTPNPAPVRFLNPLFKRSLLKGGTFTSNLTLSGSLNNIKADGTLNFEKVFLPVYDSVIENIKVTLNDKVGSASFTLLLYDTVVDFVFDFENKLTLPIVINNVYVHSKVVLIDNLMKGFASFADSASKISNTPHAAQTQSVTVLPSDVQIKKGVIFVDSILFNDVEATNMKISFSHSSKDSFLKIDNSYLGIAGGLFRGNGTYNFNTKDMKIDTEFINCDANELTKAFFNLSGEIYGSANGKFTLFMKDFTPNNYVEKITADANFEILKGKLPKLGSIEYLLRASNFIKSGIFGFTLNNTLELLKPYKYGEFNKITGNFKIRNAKIEDLKIYSQGDNLSTYTSGSYDILAGICEIEILGKLSKKISNLLGSVGNASVASLLNFVTKNKMNDIMKSELVKNINKIPLMGLSSDEYRLFNVKLQGEPSKTDAVKSFTWLN